MIYQSLSQWCLSQGWFSFRIGLSMSMLCRNGFSRIVGHPTGGSEEVSWRRYCYGHFTWRKNLEILRKIPLKDFHKSLVKWNDIRAFNSDGALQVTWTYNRPIFHGSPYVFSFASQTASQPEEIGRTHVISTKRLQVGCTFPKAQLDATVWFGGWTTVNWKI